MISAIPPDFVKPAANTSAQTIRKTVEGKDLTHTLSKGLDRADGFFEVHSSDAVKDEGNESGDQQGSHNFHADAFVH